MTRYLNSLARAQAIIETDAVGVFHMQRRFDMVHDFWLGCAAPWRMQASRMELRIPPDLAIPVAVENCWTLARSFMTEFNAPRPSVANMADFREARYFSAPDLELIGLSNAEGKMLFAGVRHGFFHARELTGDLLIRQADDDALRSLFQFCSQRENSIPQSRSASHGDPPLSDAEAAERDFLLVRTAPMAEVQQLATRVRTRALRDVFLETVLLALISEPLTYAKAHVGNRENLSLMSIALLLPEHVPSWFEQRDHFEREHPLTSHPAGGRGGERRSETINVHCRHFAFQMSSDPQAAQVDARGAKLEAERLLGSLDSDSLGGDLRRQLRMMRLKAVVQSSRLAELNRLRREPPSPHRETQGVQAARLERHRHRLECTLQRLLQDTVTLSQCGEQLKAIWQQNQGWPTGIDALRETAARLALVGYLMGEVPLLCCASGQEYARQLETEVKLLAVQADNNYGHLSMAPRNTPSWDRARAEFDRR